MDEQKAGFTSTVRVYYEDTDAGGVVYHSNYLNFMERCRSDWLASIGYDVASVVEKYGVQWVVKEANINFEAPAKLFDELTVSCHVLHMGKVSLLLEQAVYNGSKLLCSASIKLASLNSETLKLAAMPQALVQAISES